MSIVLSGHHWWQQAQARGWLGLFLFYFVSVSDQTLHAQGVSPASALRN